jgi:hypothetical protein
MERAQRGFGFLRKHWLLELIAVLLIVLLIGFLWRGWSTGFGARTSTQTTITRTYSDGVETTVTKTTARGKTLWNWMELLIVPAALGVGTLMLNRQMSQRDETARAERAEKEKLEREVRTEEERLEREDRYMEETLQHYFDTISELLLRHDFWDNLGSFVGDVARIRTVTVLRRINAERRNEVVNFLRSAALLGPKGLLSHVDMSNIDLSQTDLHGIYLDASTLDGANLSRSDLSMSYLRKASLREVNLRGTNLFGADLNGASLYKANLRRANLAGAEMGAIVSDADMSEANLDGIDLSEAVLTGTIVTLTQLRQAKSLKGAIMPNARPYRSGMLDESADGADPSA